MNIIAGIKTSNTIHLGHYFGVIKPALSKSSCYFLLADLHAMTTANFRCAEYSIAAAAVLFSINPNLMVYLQSDIAAICKLYWYLTCFSSSGGLGRMHAVKNLTSFHLSMFSYPVLMTADILALNALSVYVGQDQLQHLEFARYLIKKINNFCATNFNLPTGVFVTNKKLILGSDGRKMSKSYNNFINPFASEEQLFKQVAAYKTTSQTADEPKDPLSCPLFAIYREIASPEEVRQMQTAYYRGIAWREVKEAVACGILTYFKQYRINYNSLISNPAIIKQLLLQTQHKVAAVSNQVVTKLELALKVGSVNF